MGTIIVRRPPRRPAPPLPSGEVILDPPPEIPAVPGRGWSRLLTMLPMAAGTAAMGLMMGFQRGGPLAYVAGGMYGVSVLGMIAAQAAGQTGGAGKAERALVRQKYLRHLGQQRAEVRQTIRAQRDAMAYRHPEPAALWSTVASGRLWERRRGDADHVVVRLGAGPQELATPLVPPQSNPVDELDPLCAVALRRFVTAYSVVPDLPMAIALRDFAHVWPRAAGSAGNRDAVDTGDPVGAGDPARGLVRSLLAQVATFHAPDDVLIAFCVSDRRRPAWEWAKWLPHAQHPSRTDAAGPVRLFAASVTALEAMLDDVLANRPRFPTAPGTGPAGTGAAGPHVIVVIDGGGTGGSDHLMTEGGVDGVTLVDLSNPPPRLLDAAGVVLDIEPDGALRATTMDGKLPLGTADSLGLAAAEALARELAPLRLSAASAGETSLSGEHGLADLLGLGDPDTFDLAATWASRPNRDRLRVPIGVGTDGRPVELDLKESAQDGMGPHGLLVGATGSGKSELLRTLVLALAATHSPEILNFVLVDFKGGATFTTLDRLPHTSAVITNLADELSLVDRMLGAIAGELTRRQELLRAAGNYASQRDYERARTAGVPLAPLPSLLIVVDEFSELLTARPDFIDMFVQIGRVGRSLGVHLLLASQRLEEGRLRGLEAHLSYRIGLRTFSSMDSRAVLGVPDAYELPRSPGHGYIKSGTEPMVRFRAAYCSGPYRRDGAAPVAAGADVTDPVREFSTWYLAGTTLVRGAEVRGAGVHGAAVHGAPGGEPAGADVTTAPAGSAPAGAAPGTESLLEILVRRMEGQGVPAHQVWLPPLGEPAPLDRLLPPLAVLPGRGLTTLDAGPHGALRAVAGIVDRPFEQRRDPLWLDLSAGGGNVVVTGGPRSGKSVLLRTLLAGLALTHTPREAQFYLLDLGGGGLAALRDLPHTGTVATRREIDLVRRTVAEMAALLVERERRFAALGVDGIAGYRRLRAGSAPWGTSAPADAAAGSGNAAGDDPYGDVFLVVDGWLTLRTEFEDLEPVLADLANRGLGFGIHLLVTCARWTDLRPSLRDTFGTRLELRLGDPGDSLIGRRAAYDVPERSPGRGLAPDGAQLLVALPRVDGRADPADLTDGTASLVKAVAAAWSGPAAPPVRLLPERLSLDDLRAATGAATAVPVAGVAIGLAEADLGPVYLDFDAEPHLLLFGDTECGKSGFLRLLAGQIAAGRPPERARIILVDYRRSLLGAVTAPHLIGYGTSAERTTDLVGEVVTVMRERLPGPQVTPAQLRDRSYWHGPDLYLLVDDYDLVTGGANPLAPLLEFLPHGRDIGLHLVIARRAGGAGRAMFDPLLSRIRELAAPGVLMSGPREEGPLLGTVRPQPLPPGRGWLVTRREGARLLQLGWVPPAG